MITLIKFLSVYYISTETSTIVNAKRSISFPCVYEFDLSIFLDL